jgi:D-alanyl-D-alanine carboxypeptidase
MYSAVLSVLLMGMVPVLGSTLPELVPLADLSIASPSPFVPGSAQVPTLGKRVSASGVLVLDLQSSQQLYGRNADMRRPLASLTKLMTALLIAENHSMDEVVTVPKTINKVEGSKAPLVPGERYTVGDLLSAMLMVSANDAAEALALYHSGTEAAFVAAMNARAQELGLHDTSFANPIGLDDPAQWSTPRDIAWLALFDYRNAAIRSRMSMKQTVIRDADGGLLPLLHTHELLRQDPAVLAGKTGTTGDARECLLSVVREGGREYMVVLLGSRERYIDMRSLLRTLALLA